MIWMIWRRRKALAVLVAVSLVVAGGTSLLMDKVYESTATIVAPKEGSGGLLGGLTTSLLLQQAPALQVPSLTPNRDLVLSILKSRTMAEALVQRFGLQERYRVRYIEDAVRAIQQRSAISLSKEGIISIRVEDADPQKAADIANEYVTRLNRAISKFSAGDASNQRVFLTQQLARAKTDLSAAEEALRFFQERNRAVVLQDQARGAIEAAARLKGEIMATEIQLEVVKSFATESNPDVLALRRKVEGMKRQLGEMQYGAATDQATQRSDLPFMKFPGVGMELARLTREVKIQETLVTLLVQQVEQARMAEGRDYPMVQVLDPAIPSERPSRPRLFLNLALAGVASVLLGIGGIVVIESRRSGE
jgi:uncharacterized protein involved in exopolysaccharide biosynthesis